MTAARRRPWPTELKMPRLVDGKLTVENLEEALARLVADGPDEPIEAADFVWWVRQHLSKAPHPPSPSVPPGTRGKRSRRRYATPAGRPARIRTEARAAA